MLLPLRCLAVQSAVQPYSQQFGIGATLLSKMGFGAMQGSKGGLGAKEQVCMRVSVRAHILKHLRK